MSFWQFDFEAKIRVRLSVIGPPSREAARAAIATSLHNGVSVYTFASYGRDIEILGDFVLIDVTPATDAEKQEAANAQS